MIAKEQVLAKHPRARLVVISGPISHWIVEPDFFCAFTGDDLGSGKTEKLAWADAAKRINK